MTILFALMGILSGMFLAVQAPINALAARELGTPIAAAGLSFSVGAALLIVISLIVARGNVPLGNLGRVPPYVIFGGGCLGAFFVTTNTLLAPRLGVAALVALVIAGQLMAGMLLDHYGAFGLTARAITPMRLVGVALAFGGAMIVRFF